MPISDITSSVRKTAARTGGAISRVGKAIKKRYQAIKQSRLEGKAAHNEVATSEPRTPAKEQEVTQPRKPERSPKSQRQAPAAGSTGSLFLSPVYVAPTPILGYVPGVGYVGYPLPYYLPIVHASLTGPAPRGMNGLAEAAAGLAKAVTPAFKALGGLAAAGMNKLADRLNSQPTNGPKRTQPKLA